MSRARPVKTAAASAGVMAGGSSGRSRMSAAVAANSPRTHTATGSRAMMTVMTAHAHSPQ